MFPLLFPWLWRAAPIIKAGTGGLLLIVLGLLAYSTGGDFNQWNGIGAIMRCLPEFLIGALLYSAYREQLLGSVLATDTALLTAILLLCGLLHVAAPDFSIVPLFALLLLTAVANQGRLGPLLNAAPFLWLGNVSYSLYLIHWFVLFITTEAMRGRPGIDSAKSPAQFLTDIDYRDARGQPRARYLELPLCRSGRPPLAARAVGCYAATQARFVRCPRPGCVIDCPTYFLRRTHNA